MRPSAQQRFAAKARVNASGCWLWTGAIDPTGYGRFSVGGRMLYAHRYAVTLDGRSADGRDVDHLCRVRACVNPRHLEVVTRQVNLLRGQTLARAHHLGEHCGSATCKNCRHKAMVQTTVVPLLAAQAS